MDLIEFIKTSFWHVAPILAVGAFGLAIIIERARALFLVYPVQDPQAFFDKLADLVLGGKLGDAIALCDRLHAKPAARVVKQALLRAHQPEPLIEHGLQIAVGDAVKAIHRRTSFLATIANVATLLGLFGTIAGLITSFEAVGHADPQQKATLLAPGISQAMNATMLGLAVAIPCMLAFSFLMNRTNNLTADVEQSAVKAMDILQQRFYAADVEALASIGKGGFGNPHDAPANGRADDGGSGKKVVPLRRIA